MQFGGLKFKRRPTVGEKCGVRRPAHNKVETCAGSGDGTKEEETFGPGRVRGQETRAQLCFYRKKSFREGFEYC